MTGVRRMVKETNLAFGKYAALKILFDCERNFLHVEHWLAHPQLPSSRQCWRCLQVRSKYLADLW